MVRPGFPRSDDAGHPGPAAVGTRSSLRLLRRAQLGESSAVAALYDRHWVPLLRWAHGRLPHYARALADTADIVQDALVQTLQRLTFIEPRGPRSLQLYLHRAVQNRIKDELRRVARHPDAALIDPDAHRDAAPRPDAQFLLAEEARQYKAALASLRPADQELIVGRFELEYSYEQLALMTGRLTPDAARMALSRAVVRLAQEMART